MAGRATKRRSTIHYLVLDEKTTCAASAAAPINPVRRAEVEALVAPRAGNVTVVSTDHVSWTLDRKSDPDMLKNASGRTIARSARPHPLKGLSERNLSPTWAARLLAANPARLFRIGHMKGA